MPGLGWGMPWSSEAWSFSKDVCRLRCWSAERLGFVGGESREAVSLCRGEGEKVCMFWGWLPCYGIGRMHAYTASSMSTKRLRSGYAARSRALAVLCRECR